MTSTFIVAISYINWKVRSCDGAKHKIELYDSTSSQLAVNHAAELVEWSRHTTNGLTLLRAGTQAQTVLGSAATITASTGLCLCRRAVPASTSAIGASEALETAFAENALCRG